MKGNRGKLYEILEWLETEGEAKAISRLRMKILPFSVQEGIVISKVDKSTECSNGLLESARKAANEIVGKACPY